MIKRYVYLAGAVEIEDTWRTRAAEKLAKLGFEAINPIRGDELKSVGKHIRSNVPDSLMVIRDLNDLERTKLSAGLVLMNLNTTPEGRQPTATLMELLWCWMNKVPVIAVMGRECAPSIKNHPWVRALISTETTSITAALELIEQYFV